MTLTVAGELLRWRVTFGGQYPRTPHPTVDWADGEGWVDVWAHDELQARMMTFAVLDKHWCDLYEDGDLATGTYPLGPLASIRPIAGGWAVLDDDCPFWVATEIEPLNPRITATSTTRCYVAAPCKWEARHDGRCLAEIVGR